MPLAACGEGWGRKGDVALRFGLRAGGRDDDDDANETQRGKGRDGAGVDGRAGKPAAVPDGHQRGPAGTCGDRWAGTPSPPTGQTRLAGLVSCGTASMMGARIWRGPCLGRPRRGWSGWARGRRWGSGFLPADGRRPAYSWPPAQSCACCAWPRGGTNRTNANGTLCRQFQTWRAVNATSYLSLHMFYLPLHREAKGKEGKGLAD